MRLMCLDTWSLQLVVLCGGGVGTCRKWSLTGGSMSRGGGFTLGSTSCSLFTCFLWCEYPDPDCSTGLSPSCRAFPTMIGSILSGSKSQIGPCLLYAASGHGFSHQQKANWDFKHLKTWHEKKNIFLKSIVDALSVDRLWKRQHIRGAMWNTRENSIKISYWN